MREIVHDVLDEVETPIYPQIETDEQVAHAILQELDDEEVVERNAIVRWDPNLIRNRQQYYHLAPDLNDEISTWAMDDNGAEENGNDIEHMAGPSTSRPLVLTRASRSDEHEQQPNRLAIEQLSTAEINRRRNDERERRMLLPRTPQGLTRIEAKDVRKALADIAKKAKKAKQSETWRTSNYIQKKHVKHKGIGKKSKKRKEKPIVQYADNDEAMPSTSRGRRNAPGSWATTEEIHDRMHSKIASKKRSRDKAFSPQEEETEEQRRKSQPKKKRTRKKEKED
jgi:hypothetical protein